MLAQALTTGEQPPECTLIDLKSYPSLEALSEKALHGTKKLG